MMLGKSYAPTDKSGLFNYIIYRRLYTPNIAINNLRTPFIPVDIKVPITLDPSRTKAKIKIIPYRSICSMTRLAPSGANA